MVSTSPGSGRLLVGRVGGVAGCFVAAQLLVGLTYVLAARSMEPAGLGLVATCAAIGVISAAVFDLGLASYLVRGVAAADLSMQRARSLVSAKRKLTPLLIVTNLIPCLLIMPTPVEGAVLGLIGLLVWEAHSANALLRALEQFSRAASAQLAGRLLGLLCTIALLFTVDPELALSVGIAVSFGADALIGRALLGPSGAAAASLREMAAIQRRSVSFGLVTLSTTGQQLDTPLVTAGAGVTAGGIYAGAGRLVGPLLFLSSSLALVAAPWLARAQHDRVALRAEERRISRIALVLALGPLGAAAVGPTAVPWILGEQYVDSGVAFSILAIGGSLSTVSQSMATILQNRGAERSVGTAISIGLAIGLVSTLVLAVISGPVWAAAGFLLSQAYIVVHLAIRLRRVRAAGAHRRIDVKGSS